MRHPDLRIDDLVYQFRVILDYTQPMVWRRIVVPGPYSFWDLHVAIQDAMGWWDYHLHVFRIRNPETGRPEQIGIPMEENTLDGIEPDLPGWEIAMASYFLDAGDRAEYEYDFGDGWRHDVVLEKISERPPRSRYPICIDGARACPPEDCGGPPGYEDLLRVLADRNDEEYPSMREWVGADYDPAAFDPANVRFEDPQERWQKAFTDRTPDSQNH